MAPAATRAMAPTSASCRGGRDLRGGDGMMRSDRIRLRLDRGAWATPPPACDRTRAARRGGAGIQAHFGAARRQHQRDAAAQCARAQDGDGAGGDVLWEFERHGDASRFWAGVPPAGFELASIPHAARSRRLALTPLVPLSIYAL